MLAVDAKDGKVATDGWLSVSTRTAVEVVREMADLPLAAVLYTDIARDGTHVGPNIEATARLAARAAFRCSPRAASRSSTISPASPSTPASPAPSSAAPSTKKSSRSKKPCASPRDDRRDAADDS